jgi:hypothetical protein
VVERAEDIVEVSGSLLVEDKLNEVSVQTTFSHVY